MSVTREVLSRPVVKSWTWLCHAAVVTWRWIRRQWDAMIKPAPADASPRLARRAEKQRRKEIRRQLKEKAVRRAA